MGVRPFKCTASALVHFHFLERVVNTTMRITSKKRLALGLVALSLATGALTGGPSIAKADPPASLGLSYSGVGSDTTQNVMDAFSGQSNGISYPRAIVPVTGGLGAVIESYDASIQTPGSTDPCITTSFNGVAFTRPNGSGAGTKALSAANAQGLAGNPTRWLGNNNVFANKICGQADFISPNNTAAIAIANSVNIAGQVAFARSSSGPGSGSGLTWVPFARDAVTAGYVFKNITGAVGAPIALMTRKDLIDIYNSGPKAIVSGGQPVLLMACDINVASGTRKFFGGVVVNALMSGTPAALPTGSPSAANGICNSTFQENELVGVSARADALALANPTGITFNSVTYTNIQLVVGFSAAGFIAQSNGAAPSLLPTSGSFGIAAISDTTTTATCAQATPLLGSCNIGVAFTGTGPLTASPIFFGDAIFGRNVFNVLPSSVMTTLAGDSTDVVLRSLFFGPTSPICLGTSIISTFGYLNLAVGNGTGTSTCGSIGAIGGWTPPSSTLS